MAGHYYYLICLKRSRFADSEVSEYTSEWFKQCKIVYWLPDNRGYTESESEAGLYSMEDVEDCAGMGLDWFCMRTPYRIAKDGNEL